MSSNSVSGYMPRSTEGQISHCRLPVFTAHYSQQPRGGSEPVSIHSKMDSVVHPRMAQYPAMERQDILTPAATWTSLEDVTLSQLGQSQKDVFCMTHA